jgi:uncharacterized protein (UPF0548 family)
MCSVISSFRRPSLARLRRELERASGSNLTYAEVGATRLGRTPSGYRNDKYSIELGTGKETFRRAVKALQLWQAQQRAGVMVFPTAAPVMSGTTIILVINAIAIWVLAPCRVVYVIDCADHFGLAYGTLERHPEQGEAAFNLFLRDDQRVYFEINSFSRPANVLTWSASPLTRWLQRRVTQRYLTSLSA